MLPEPTEAERDEAAAEALRAYTSKRDNQNFDELDHEEQGDAITNAIADILRLGKHNCHDPVHVVRTAFASLNLAELAEQTVSLREPIDFQAKVLAKRGQTNGRGPA